ncbi:hypothetical protein [Acidithiobacillus ferriphilus]|uniref:hypothetical protein n=1 Tax=Acidithiobacillus ferriphilus TaxID=1689834 RepID=UPI001C06CE02|nr:hypothetical protein [Acidithiobacillus ferriphilus]
MPTYDNDKYKLFFAGTGGTGKILKNRFVEKTFFRPKKNMYIIVFAILPVPPVPALFFALKSFGYPGTGRKNRPVPTLCHLCRPCAGVWHSCR